MKQMILKLMILQVFSITSVMANQPKNIVKVDVPDIKNGKLLVIVPAKKYSMKGPLFEKLAKRAVLKGFIVVRLDWLFFTAQSTPSKDFKSESMELERIIEFYKNKYQIPTKDVVIAAKSFGTQVLMKVNSSKYGKLGLITPNCDEETSFSSRYGKILNLKKDIQISISVDDPYCDIKQIYSSVSSFDRKISLYTTFGDHNFNVSNNKLNQDMFVEQFINWLENFN